MSVDPSNNSSHEDFMHDFLESLANEREMQKYWEQREEQERAYQEQESLYFYFLTYLVIDVGINIVKAQVAAAQEVMRRFELEEWTMPNFLSDNPEDYPF